MDPSRLRRTDPDSTKPPLKLQVSKRRPRTRGGAPWSILPELASKSSSPHTRGCSTALSASVASASVVPAHAGVLPRYWLAGLAVSRRPRTRGGAPCAYGSCPGCYWSSPHTRGCSVAAPFPEALPGVVPATRGGAPRDRQQQPQRPQSSPHTRGCSRQWKPGFRRPSVVPAHAGVLRIWTPCDTFSVMSSPHTRGCSAVLAGVTTTWMVVPAHAGVLPLQVGNQMIYQCRPRTRGGAPYYDYYTGVETGNDR
jgi:hypothetical protein